MISNQKQKAISTLNTAHDLESIIPTQFRNKKRLKYVHSKMNQLRKERF